MSGTEKKTLQPWEQKLIGKKDRYTDSWTGWLANKFWSVGESYFDSAIDSTFTMIGKSINPDVHKYELYGKKVDRPWGRGWDIVNSLVEKIVTSDMVKKSVSDSIKAALGDKKQVQHSSGLVVATACFAPSVMQEENRPPVHFDEHYLVQFYNELGIVPDEAAMIGDMFAETIKIKDNNFTDEQWRTYVMPIIISESYKKELNTVYGILHHEYMNNPAMTREQLEKRMDRATNLLGQLYQDFSLSMANATDYLEAPLNLLDTDKKQKAPENLDEKLSPEEIKKYNAHKTYSLVTKSELANFKKILFKTPRPEQKKDLIQAFYRSTSFINAAAAFKTYKEKIGNNPSVEEKEIAELMRGDLSQKYSISEADLAYISSKENSISDIHQKFGITEEALLGYEKREVPPLETQDQKAGSYYNAVVNTVTVNNISKIVFDGSEVVYEKMKTVVQGASEAVKVGYELGEIGADIVKEGGSMLAQSAKELGDFVQNGIGDIEIEFDDEDLGMIPGEDKGNLIRENYEKQQEQERLERKKKEEEQEKIRQAEERNRKIEEEAKKAQEKERAFEDLAPWQKKAIGIQARHTQSWFGYLIQGISKDFGDAIEHGVDNAFQYLGASMNPDVTQYEVFGKKLKRPWGKLAGVQHSLMANAIRSDKASAPLKTVLKRSILAPGVDQYVSGDTVALHCFAPTFIQGENRPPCHFSTASMVRFYNATGIEPDEHAIIADMMAETQKIADANYTDAQWRSMLMPQIIKGSYRKQLNNVFEMIKEDYRNNPSITEEMLRNRLEAASTALGEMYSEFSERVANTTEYLEAPMNLFGDATANEFPDAVKNHLSEEQKKVVGGIKTQSLTTKSEIDRMIRQAAAVRRPEDTVPSLLEQFYKATSGYIGNIQNVPNYTPKVFDAEHRDIHNEQCMMAAIASAKKMAEMLAKKSAEKQGFFARLFGRTKDVSEEKICLAAMKDSLQAYGFDANKVDQMLDPKTSLADIKKDLGIADKAILGILEREIPQVSEDKSIADYARDYAQYLNPVGKVAIGAVDIVKRGAIFVFSKASEYLYSMINSGQPAKESKEEVIAEIPVIENQIDDQIINDFKESENTEYQNQSYLSWGISWFNSGWTKEAAMQQLEQKKGEVIQTLKAGEADKPGLYNTLAKLEYYTTIGKALDQDRLTPDSVVKGLGEARVNEGAQKMADSKSFQAVCDRMLKLKGIEERIADPTFPEKLHSAALSGNKAKMQHQHIEKAALGKEEKKMEPSVIPSL